MQNSELFLDNNKNITKIEQEQKIFTCAKCFLIECCCELDRLQIIDDDNKAIKNGYKKINDRWIKNSKTNKKF